MGEDQMILLDSTYLATPVGVLLISGSETGISSILFKEEKSGDSEHPASLQECCRQLDEYFAGKRTTFDLLLDPAGTPFQMRVWEELLKIPFGTTITYLELANRLDDPLAVRAVGHANGQNRINILIPCHRVIGAGGKLVGYGGGLWRKEWLLKHEAKLNMPGLFSTN